MRSPWVAPSVAAAPSKIHIATLSSAVGAVQKGAEITEADAVARRKVGLDIVVCGANKNENQRIAAKIERTANGDTVRDPPHKSAGSRALPHFHPKARIPLGHSFYETENLKAV